MIVEKDFRVNLIPLKKSGCKKCENNIPCLNLIYLSQK